MPLFPGVAGLPLLRCNAGEGQAICVPSTLSGETLVRRGGLRNTGGEKMAIAPVGKAGVCWGVCGVDMGFLGILVLVPAPRLRVKLVADLAFVDETLECLLSSMVSKLYNKERKDDFRIKNKINH